MNARYLTDYPLDGYLHTRRSRVVALRRDKFNLRPVFESLGWVFAGATVGSMVVMMGAWGLSHLTESTTQSNPVTAMTYQMPSALSQH